MPPAADALVETPAERACLQACRDLSGDPVDGPMERHSVRCFLLAEALGKKNDKPVDREVLLCAALLHDLGLYEGAKSKNNAYVTDGRVLADKVLAPFDWPTERRELVGAAVERHHELVPQWGRGNEVELLRRADLVEVSQHTIRFGLPKATRAEICARAPRKGFVGEVARELGTAMRERPRTIWRIFRPG